MISGTAKRGRPAQKRVYIAEEIARRIEAGVYSVQIPTLDKLIKEFGVNGITIRSALDSLVERGLIEKRGTVGVFVKTKRRIAFIFLTNNENNIGSTSFRLDNNIIYGPLMDGMTKEFESHNFTLYARCIRNDDAEAALAVKNDADACVMILSPNEEGAFIETLNRVNLPWVRVMGLPGDMPKCIHYTYDNTMIGSLAADYLVKEKAKVFLYFGHEIGFFDERVSCFQKRLGDNGTLAYKCNAIVGMDEKALFSSAKNGISKAISKHPGERLGIYVSSDIFLPSVYQAIYSLGLIPAKDVAIISVDANPFCMLGLYPRPPSIDIRMEEIGRKAAASLLHAILSRASSGSERVIFPPVITTSGGYEA